MATKPINPDVIEQQISTPKETVSASTVHSKVTQDLGNVKGPKTKTLDQKTLRKRNSRRSRKAFSPYREGASNNPWGRTPKLITSTEFCPISFGTGIEGWGRSETPTRSTYQRRKRDRLYYKRQDDIKVFQERKRAQRASKKLEREIALQKSRRSRVIYDPSTGPSSVSWGRNSQPVTKVADFRKIETVEQTWGRTHKPTWATNQRRIFDAEAEAKEQVWRTAQAAEAAAQKVAEEKFKTRRSLSADINHVAGKTIKGAEDFFRDSKIARNTKEFLGKTWKNKWARFGAKGVLGAIGVNLGLGLVRKVFQGPAIPDDYERGYDIISSYTTDYGSPLNLAKAAQKAIRPYYSTVRSAGTLRTNVNAVLARSPALQANKMAIGHNRY